MSKVMTWVVGIGMYLAITTGLSAMGWWPEGLGIKIFGSLFGF